MTVAIRQVAIVVLVLAAVGCGVGPEPRTPPAPIGAGWESSTGESLDDRRLAGWWHAIDDPALNAAVDQALAGNRDLATAIARLDAAAARYGISRSGLFPSVDLSASAIRSDPSDRTGNQDAGVRTEYLVGVDVAWEVDLWGAVRRGRDYALAEVRAAGFSAADVSRLLVTEVVRTIAGAGIFTYRADLAERQLVLRGERLALSLSRQGAGIGLPDDSNQDSAAQAAAKAARDDLATAATRAGLRLRELSGLPATAAIPVMVGLPVLPTSATVGVPADLLRRRPDVRRAEQRLLAAGANVGIATAELYPRLTLSGNVGLDVWRGVGGSTADGVFWGLGPRLRWRLFEGGAVEAGIAVATADSKAAVLEWEGAVIRAQREVADGLARLDQARKEVVLRSTEVAHLSAVESLARRRQQSGIGDPRLALDAAIQRIAAEDRHAQAVASQLDAFVALATACGGGWDIQ